MTPPERLSDVELTALERSSGDDCDMASVECVVRELRALRTRLAQIELSAGDRDALGHCRTLIGARECRCTACLKMIALLDRLTRGEGAR